MVENTHQKYEKNQNKTSVAKRFTGPFLALLLLLTMSSKLMKSWNRPDFS
jgi:hypothetical protein